MNRPTMSVESLEYCPTPSGDAFGVLQIRAREGRITAIEFTAGERSDPCPDATTSLACRQLAEYFAGARRVFELPLAPQGSDFQRQVWAALAGIRYGETCSYGELARAIGRPGAPRAVGAANGRNPIIIVIPCHRVVASDGGIGGYSAGVARKQWLLAHEQGVKTPRLTG